MLAFVQISDVHFSEVLGNTTNGNVYHQDPHALAYCSGLLAALRDARSFSGLGPDDSLPVVCSGDLTLSGGEEQFQVGHTFLRNCVRISRRMPVDYFGIDAGDDDLAVVPGNHDQWQGLGGRLGFLKGVPAHAPGLAGRQFRKTPWRKEWVASDKSVHLEIFGVDSTSGHAGAGSLGSKKASYTQGGSISTQQLTQLEVLLNATAVKGDCARAIVCHHSLAYNSWLPAIQNLDARSKDELRRLARTYGVMAILTGHTHDFYAGHVGNAHGQLIELRCASTTATKQKINGFYLHQLTAKPLGAWQWTTWQYAWNTLTFGRLPKPVAQF